MTDYPLAAVSATVTNNRPTKAQRRRLRNLGYRWHDDPTLTRERAGYLIGKLNVEQEDSDAVDRLFHEMDRQV
jgi:hypothetical protein